MKIVYYFYHYTSLIRQTHRWSKLYKTLNRPDILSHVTLFVKSKLKTIKSLRFRWLKYHDWIFLSLPDLKGQVSFSDQNLSVVSRRCCCRCCKLFTSSSSSPEPLSQFLPNLSKASLGKGDKKIFSRITGPISTKLGTIQPWVKRFKFVQRYGPQFSTERGGGNNEKAKIH